VAIERKCGACSEVVQLTSVTQFRGTFTVMFLPVGSTSMGSAGVYQCQGCLRSFTLRSAGAIAGLAVALVCFLLVGLLLVWIVGASSSQSATVTFLLLVDGLAALGMGAIITHQVWLRLDNPPR
jgi:hypothetical protein